MTNVQERVNGTIAITAATQQPAIQAPAGAPAGAMLQPSDTIRRLFAQPQQQPSLYMTGPLQPGGGAASGIQSFNSCSTSSSSCCQRSDWADWAED